MSFCPFIKDAEMRFNLHQYTFSYVWDELIPSVREKTFHEQEYKENCAICDLREDCNWCPVFSYLEYGRYTAKIDYLCEISKIAHQQKKNWTLTCKRFFEIAGVSIMVCSDLPFSDDTFSPILRQFEVDEPGDDLIFIRLVPTVPSLSELNLGREFSRQDPWTIYRQRDTWTYVTCKSDNGKLEPFIVSIFNDDHSHANIFTKVLASEVKNRPSLTTFPTDQLLLARIMADRQACYFHSAGMVMQGLGFLFVGHSDAGKSTMMKLLRGQGEMLGDDRIIVRQWPEGFRIHGTWSHGELNEVSPADAPLQAILFLEQAKTNEIIPITDKRDLLGLLLSHVIKGLATDDWWEKILNLIGEISAQVPAYRLLFDKSGQVSDILKQLYE
jgi:hypothetical protein